jgi:hypothetical protein
MHALSKAMQCRQWQIFTSDERLFIKKNKNKNYIGGNSCPCVLTSVQTFVLTARPESGIIKQRVLSLILALLTFLFRA